MDIPLEIDAAWEKEKAAEKENAGESLSGVRVLLVEDNDLNLEIAQFILENAGIDVIGARNGQEAVEFFEKSAPGQFDLILMDVMMPVMDGLAATRAIRALDRVDAKTIPIFAMTANAFVEDVEASRNAGMNEHLSKPLDEEKMLRAIRRYVQTGKRERSDG